MSAMAVLIVRAIHFGIVALLWMPLIVTTDAAFPSIVGKAIFARSTIEVLFVLWLVLLMADPRYRPPRSWVLYALAGSLVVSVVSAGFGASFTKSIWSDFQRMTGLWDLLHWYALILVAASVVRSAGGWALIFNWNLAITLGLSVIALTQAYGGDLSFLPFLPSRTYEILGTRVVATLGNASFLAAVLILNVLLATGFLARSFLPGEGEGGEQAGWLILGKRAFWAVVVVSGVWVLFLTGTRGALLGLAAGAALMAAAAVVWSSRGALRPVLLGSIAIFALLGGLFALDRAGGFPDTSSGRLSQPETGQERVVRTTGEDASVSLRFLFWKAGARAFVDRPFLGWGPENYSVAFDRFVRPSHHTFLVDRAHNSVVEELATRGILGLLTFAALWVVITRSIVRRRRSPRGDVLAYAVLGGLIAYFVQNLVLFDSPAMLLQWALLVGWVVAQDRGDLTGEPAGVQPRAPRAFDRERMLVAVALLVVLGLSIYVMNFRPYAASRDFRTTITADLAVGERLEVARRGFDSAPGLAVQPRQFMVRLLASNWHTFGAEERQLALDFFEAESEEAREAEPQSHRLERSFLLFRQATASSREELALAEPHLERIQELGPWRADTYLHRTAQALLERDPEKALIIIDEYVALAPKAASLFDDLKAEAERLLAG